MIRHKGGIVVDLWGRNELDSNLPSVKLPITGQPYMGGAQWLMPVSSTMVQGDNQIDALKPVVVVGRGFCDFDGLIVKALSLMPSRSLPDCRPHRFLRPEALARVRKGS